MTTSPIVVDPRGLDTETRTRIADLVHDSPDFAWPDLPHWNDSPCARHANHVLPSGAVGPFPGCPDCGIRLRRHQRVGATWLYYRGNALLADTVGSGKTSVASGLLALMLATGELADHPDLRPDRGRALVVCRAAAVLQWRDELIRMIPSLTVATATGNKSARLTRYSQSWHVLVTSPQTYLRDYQELRAAGLHALVVDDVDAIRHFDTATHRRIRALSKKVARTVVLTGTPLQKKLGELYALTLCLGGYRIFGSYEQFQRRYLRIETVKVYNRRTGKTTTKTVEVGTKHLDEFKATIAPLALRRTAADIDDVDLPTIIPSHTFLDLYPAQRARYAQLADGVLALLAKGRERIKHVTALTALSYGARICTGLASLGEDDGPGTSVKLDYLMDLLSGDLDGEKVVIFTAWKDTVRALQRRLDTAGIGHVSIWGEQPDQQARHVAVSAFRSDPATRVLIGTQAIEQSLNLQVARHMVNLDMLMNPARMEQLAGRIRRDGSAYTHVYVHNLLTADTQEERYLPSLQREQALIDAVWDERSQLFAAADPATLLALITGGNP